MPKMRKRPKGKSKIIDLLPKSFKGPLDKPRLRDLTVADLHTVKRQLDKYFDDDPVSFLSGPCSICTKWMG